MAQVLTMAALTSMAVCFAVVSVEKSTAITSFADNRLDISVSVNPSKPRYTIGEVVKFDINVENRGTSDVKIRSIDVRSGYIQLFLAKNNLNFEKYSSSVLVGGGQKRIILEPGRSLHSKGDIFWNYKKGRILNDYAFDEPGVYRLKAVMILPDENGLRVESPPVDIVMEAATGSDLEVWNRIKNNADFAYFIQQGELRGANKSSSDELLSSLRLLSSEYPESLLAKQITDSLSRYDQMLTRKAEFLRKIQK